MKSYKSKPAVVAARLSQEEMEQLDLLPGKSRNEKVRFLLRQKSLVDSLQNMVRIQHDFLLQKLESIVQQNEVDSGMPYDSKGMLTAAEFRIVMEQHFNLFALLFYSLTNLEASRDKNTLASSIARKVRDGSYT